jgi:hypothetical protein
MNKKEQSKQTMWETWFVASAIIFFAYFFVGTLENSRIDFPNYPYFAMASVFNLAASLYYGTKRG